jgi:hypothetical protein
MGGRKKRRAGPDDLVTAAEIACWAYCPEQWRLEYGLGLEPENRAALKAGTRYHDRKAVAERVAGGSILLGRFLAVLAAVVLLLLLWWWLSTFRPGGLPWRRCWPCCWA